MHLALTVIDALEQRETVWPTYRRIAPKTVAGDLRAVAERAIRLARYLERQEPEKSPNREGKRLPTEIENCLTDATNGSRLELKTASAPEREFTSVRSLGFPWGVGPARR